MLIKNALVADCDQIVYADVRITDGKIVEIGNDLAPRDTATQIINADGLTLLPAFIDMHCHFRDPGLEQKETLQTGSAAAAHGGYTFVNLMANTNPVCSTAQQAEEVQQRAKKIGICNVNQVISLTENFDGKTLTHLEKLPSHIRVLSEDGKGVTTNDVMAKALQLAAKKDLLICSHAEDMTISKYDYRLAENIETARNILLAEYYGAKLHMCHVSTKESMQYVAEAKQRGAQVTCEVCPHHIWFDDETCQYRVNPPIRQKADVKYLIKAMLSGKVDCIATDHAPHTDADKANGAPGMVGLETAFAVCYTKLCLQNNLPLTSLSRMMSRGGAKLLGLNKGKIEVGFDGDVVLVNTAKEFMVDKNSFASKSHNTPFDGEKLHGEIVLTVKNGHITYKNETYNI
ncbi:MAG: dihydroorotase [Oscillospiraceae bacterium]|nr:dihydroorotase [Oscillospiraceae bacterium]